MITARERMNIDRDIIGRIANELTVLSIKQQNLAYFLTRAVRDIDSDYRSAMSETQSQNLSSK